MRETQQDIIFETRLKTIEEFSSATKPDWITEEARKVHESYSQLRENILTNRTKWNYFDYCHRWSNHYYNIALMLYTYFQKHKNNLDIIRMCIDKCMSKLNGIRSSEREINKTNELYTKATAFKAAIDKLYINLENKLNAFKSEDRMNQAKVLINLGHVDYDNFDFTANELFMFRCNVLGVLLLNFINDSEELLTLHVEKDHYSKANICRYLARAYQVCGQQILCNDFNKRANQQITLAFQELGEEDSSPKTRQMVRQIIKEQVLKYHKELTEIYKEIKREYTLELNNLDCEYVDRKFIKYCIQGLSEEIHGVLLKMKTSTKNRVFIKLLANMEKVKTLQDFQDSFTTGPFYKLVTQHQKILKPGQLKAIIKDFKRDVWFMVSPKISGAQSELDLLKQLIIFLRSVTKCRPIIMHLQLSEFCAQTLSVKSFIENILHLDVPDNEELPTLKSLAEEIKDKTALFFMDKFVDALNGYAFPPEPVIKGDVMELKAKLVILSEVMKLVLKKKTEDIKELRIVGADIVFVDESLGNDQWPGMNVLIVCKTIHVQGNQIWDVSGRQAEDHSTKAEDGVTPGEDGKNGKSGNSGHSGGNVYISCTNIINSSNWSIISNGGPGGAGQTGGNGAAGVSGTGVKLSEFENLINPPEPSYNFTQLLVKLAVGINPFTLVGEFDIDKEIHKLQDRNLPNIPLPKISREVKIFDVTWSKSQFRVNVWNTAPCFFTTQDDRKITYSYYPQVIPGNQEVLILYEGTLAQIGGQAGKGGPAGPGGYPGELIIKCAHPTEVSLSNKPGEEGQPGKPGQTGPPGRNGWDMGFVFVNNVFAPVKKFLKWVGIGSDWRCETTKKIIGRNQDCKLTLKYHYGRKDEDFVYCPYRAKELNYSDHYIEVASRSSKTNVYERNKTKQQNQEEEQQQRATKTKAISRSVIAQEETDLSIDVIDELVNIALDLEGLKEQALEEIIEKDEEKETETTNFQVQRQAVFDDSILQRQRKILKKHQRQSKVKPTRNITVEQIFANPSNIDSWIALKSVVVTLSDLDKLFSLLTSQRQQFGSKFTRIYNCLLSKYKIAMCQQIDQTKQLPEIEVYFKPTPIEKYLIAGSDGKEYTQDDFELGSIQDYFKPNHEDLLPGLQKYLNSADVGLILYPLKFFIMEKSHNNRVFKEQSQIVLDKLNTLENRLERLIKCYIVAYEKDQSSSMMFKIERRKKEIIQQFKDETSWDFVLKEFAEYIPKVGMSSTAVRELLCCAFDVNIQIFLLNQNYKLIKYHDHNPVSKNTLYYFLENGQFVQFNLDHKFVNLITERKKQSKNYTDLLSFINGFVCKKDFDEFYTNFDGFNGFESSDTKYLQYKKLSYDKIIDKICEYFPETNENTIRPVLNKLKPKIIRNSNILKALLQRFGTEGLHVSIHELVFIATSILVSYVEKSSNLELYEWILLVKPQNKWLNEVCYIELENHFQQSLKSTSIYKNILRAKQKDILLLMNKKLQEATDTINLKCISTCLEVLSEIEIDEETVRCLPLSKWQYSLREQLLEYRLCCLTTWQANELQLSLYYLNCLESNIGSGLIDKLLGVLDVQKDSVKSADCIGMFRLLYLQEWSLDDDLLLKISTYGMESVRLELERVQKKTEEVRSLETILKVIENNSNTSTEIQEAMTSFSTHPFLHLDSIKKPFSKEKIGEWSKSFKESIKGLNKTDKEQYIAQHTNEILTMIAHAIKLKTGFLLRVTQRVAILLMISHNFNTLSQISTGEGKSLIVVAVSIFKALCGEKVDIITSSSVLAMRDATVHEDIYKIINISVNHNCSEKLDERRDAYSNSLVIFGDLSNFQRDYLIDRFYGKNILGDRTFDTLIVDEVDSMLLDKGNNTLYLSHEIPGLDKLESVYQFLWKRICMSVGRKIDNFEQNLKQEVLFDLYGTLSIEDLEAYLGVPKHDANTIYNYLKDIKVVDQKHKVLREISDEDVAKLSNQHKLHIHKIKYIINQIIKRNIEIKIPKCLYKFVEHHVDVWIKNGLLAIVMEEGIDYVVDVDRTQTKADINPNITIIDKGTGTDQSNSQWEEALHQFLQLKHGCKVSAQSLKAVFISNVSYFKKYSKLFGLTGTLGSSAERDLLQDLYKVQFVNIPTAKPKKFIEHEPLLCCTEIDWQFRIVNRTTELVKDNRSVLIICETIKEVNLLAKAFQQTDINNLKIYKREFEDCPLAQGEEELDGGSVIIGTNLTGRGTDIKITKNLNENGGLHVLLTYLPSNTRIEQQAFGRAARSGCNGSGQLIIISYGSFLDKREQRESDERQRIADIKVFFDTRIKVEENFFENFSEVYKKCKNKYSVETNLREIALQRLLDRWAFWIDEHGSKLSETSINKTFDAFKRDLKDNFSEWKKWTSDPIQLVKIGLIYMKKESYSEAIKVFDAIIEQEPKFCEAAHYYKAAALAADLDFEKRPFTGKHLEKYEMFLAEMKKAERLFEGHKDTCMESSAFVQNLKQNMKNSFMTIDAYRTQQETMITLYDFYIRSINDIVGYQVSKGSFISQEVKQDDSEKIYNAFLETSVLEQSFIAEANDEDVEEISISYGIPQESLSSFLQSYKNRTIKEQDFLNALKLQVKMPNLEECWDTLVKEHKLVNEVKFVSVQKSKLTTTKQEDLLKEIPQIKINIKDNKGKHVFMKQYISSSPEETFIFNEKTLKSSLDSNVYEALKKGDTLVFNRTAALSQENIANPISRYDSLTVQNLTSATIAHHEAENIVNSLVENKFLKSNPSGSYCLINEYNEDKLPDIPTYDQAVSQVLRLNFAYRIALQNIQSDLKNTSEQVYLKIISEPHTSLMWDLVAKKIIQPVKVKNHTSSDIDSVLDKYGKNSEAKKSINNYVKGVLKKLVGTLKSLDTPKFKLLPLIESMDELPVSPLQELNTFQTNSLDFIIKPEEKKYTWKMIWGAIIVTVLGLLEVTAGLAIQVYFAGALSHLGNWLISEGISDLQYAASSWWTGHFDWNDYGRHKLQSMVQSFLLACFSALYARGFTYSRFGEKLAMKGVYGEGGKEIAKMTGSALAKEVSGKAIAKEFGKQFVVKVGEGLTRGLMNECVNSLVDSYLQNLCNQLANSLVTDIETAVNSHRIGQTLHDCYRVLGPRSSKDLIVHYSEKKLSQTSTNAVVIVKTLEITGAISSIITEASTRGKTMEYAQYVTYLQKALQYSQYASHLFDIVASVRRMLDNVDEELRKNIRDAVDRGVREHEYNAEEATDFKNDVLGQWRKMLRENANSIFTEKIAKPVLQQCAFTLAKGAKDGVKKLYNFTRNKYHKHVFNTTKAKKETALRDTSLSEETRKQIIESYHDALAELKAQVRDPHLYAEIVMEKGHMDAICVKATSSILDRLRGNDKRPIKLSVATDSGASIECSTTGIGQCREINLQLTDKHFTNTNSDVAGNSTDYECLYRSLVNEFPELGNMTMDEFRSGICKEITTNRGIKNDIKQGKHAFTIRRKMYGGYREEAIRVDTLRQNLKEGKYFYSQSSVSDTSTRDKVPLHLSQLAESMEKNFDETKRINVVELECGKYIFLDNRRVVAASTIDNPEVKILVRVFKYDEVLPPDLQKQYSTKDVTVTTAGMAAEVRIQRSSSFGEVMPRCVPYSPKEVRIRKSKEVTKVTTKEKEEFYRRTDKIGFRKEQRTKSSDRITRSRG